MGTLLKTLIAATALISTALAEDARPPRVLLVTGVDHPAHNWQITAPAILDILAEDNQFTVRIVEQPELLASEMIFDYDLAFLHFRNDKPLAREERVRKNLTRFVKQGGGLVALHFACGAFGDWPEFRNLVGKIWDGKNTHDPRGPFTVRITKSDHVITRGMGDFQADDELYIGLVGERPVQLLATARSKLTGKDHPMAFAFTYGNGRVFHTPLGHDEKAIRVPGTADLIRRGCAWAAGRDQ
jgi:type 1 glutamine amidotransferase